MAIYLLFIQHIIYSLTEKGKTAIVVPTGFLTAKNGIEKNIKKYLINEKMLSGVISMPSNIFATTGTNVSIIFLDKSEKHEQVLLVDASEMGEEYKDGKNQRTKLRDFEIEKIVNTFDNKIETKEFSIMVELDEIEKKNYSFSAGQYFETQIEYLNLTQEEFQKKIDNDKKLLKELFNEDDKYNKNILISLEGLKYDI